MSGYGEDYNPIMTLDKKRKSILADVQLMREELADYEKRIVELNHRIADSERSAAQYAAAGEVLVVWVNGRSR